MDRRKALSYLGGIVAAAGLSACGDGGKDGQDQTCNLSGTTASTASVNLAQFFQTEASLQLQNMWCWAACISMIFSHRGHPVSQSRIVTEA